MKAVLLGANGQLGTDIRSVNLRTGERLSITAIDRGRIDLSDVHRAAIKIRELDFECLINCSSYHKTDEVERTAQLAFTINAHLVRALAEVCQEKRARFVHISTDYVFGGALTKTPLTERDPKAPINVYGASKAMGEDLALLDGGDVLILRVASLFGVAGASGKGGNFIETMIRLATEEGVVRVVDDQTMSPTGTSDVAAALLKLLDQGADAGIWHVVNAGSATWCDFATEIVSRAKIAATVVPITSSDSPNRARRPSYSVLDNSKLVTAIGPIRHWWEALDCYLRDKGHQTTPSDMR